MARICTLSAWRMSCCASRSPISERQMRTQSCAVRTKAPEHTGNSPLARISSPCAWKMPRCASRFPIFGRDMRTQSCALRTKWVRDGSPKKRMEQPVLLHPLFGCSGRLNVQTICYIFNFIGCGNADWFVIKGKNQLDIIVVNENRFDETVNKLRLVCTHFRSTRYLH